MILTLDFSVTFSSPTSPFPDYILGVGQWGSPNMCFQLVPWAAISSFHQINVGPAVKRSLLGASQQNAGLVLCTGPYMHSPPPHTSCKGSLYVQGNVILVKGVP